MASSKDTDTAEGHITKKNTPRLGYYNKGDKSEGKHVRDYIANCPSEYYKDGYKNNVHHIIPQTSIKESTDGHAQPEFLEVVMWITDWSINNKGNLVALPGFTSYLRHFHDSSSRWSSVTASWFYSVLSLTALPQSPIPGPSPEFLPIHQPVSWGHTRYNKLVKARLKANVWNKVSGEQNGHKAKAQEVQAELESMQSSLKTSLVPRPMANRATWQARTNTAATRSTWYLPFCMVAVTNPIDGR